MAISAEQQLLEVARDVTLAGNGVDWVDAFRKNAAKEFGERGLPTATMEDWRYTNLRGLARKFPQPVLAESVGAQGSVPAVPARILDLVTIRLVFVDGQFSAKLSDGHINSSDMLVENLASVLKRDSSLVKGLVGDRIGNHAHGFTAINSALLDDGCVIRFGKNADLLTPIELVYLSTGSERSRFARNVIHLDQGSRATVIERFVSVDENASGLTSVISEISVGANASLSHYRIQEENAASSHVGGSYVGVAADGRYRNATASLGGNVVRNDLVVALNGKGADCQLDGVVIGQGKTHVDNFTRIEHHEPHGTSREHYRSVLDDRSRSIFHGRVFVAVDAQKTDAQQSNQSLLLSEYAESDSKPQLEIYADDVKCAHGATVGQLDENSVFYLKSRGIGDDEARGMLTVAFASEALVELDNDPLRKAIELAVRSRLAPELAEAQSIFEDQQ